MAKAISIPTIKWGKRKSRSQMCEVFTEDGRILDIEMDVLHGCVDDPITGQGFLLDADDQFLGEDGYWHQILGDRSAIPICMINSANVKEDELTDVLNNIFHESQEAAKLEQYERAAKNAIWDRLWQIVVISCVTILLIFGAQLLWGN